MVDRLFFEFVHLLVGSIAAASHFQVSPESGLGVWRTRRRQDDQHAPRTIAGFAVAKEVLIKPLSRGYLKDRLENLVGLSVAHLDCLTKGNRGNARISELLGKLLGVDATFQLNERNRPPSSSFAFNRI